MTAQSHLAAEAEVRTGFFTTDGVTVEDAHRVTPEHIAGVIVAEAAEQLAMWREAAPKFMTGKGYRGIALTVEEFIADRMRHLELDVSGVHIEPPADWAARHGYGGAS